MMTYGFMDWAAVAATVSQPASIPFAAAFIGGLFIYQIRNRRQMLACKALVDGFYALHFFMLYAYAGAFASGIAVLGGLVQAVTPDHRMRETMIWRNIGAAGLAGVGALVAAHNHTDLLPLIAAVMARFIETSSRPQYIRIGILVPLALWMNYAAEKELYLMLMANVTVMSSLLLAIYRHRSIRRTMAVAP